MENKSDEDNTGLNTSLVVLYKEFTGALFEEAEHVVLQVQHFRLKLRKLRLANNEKHSFDYSKPLTSQEGKEVETMLEEREQFFNSIILLMDRQPDDDVRYELLCLLGELGAIEVDYFKGGRVSERTDPYAFGKQALQTMLDIIPSVVNIEEPFIDCVKDVLIEVIKRMDKLYLIACLPLLIGMCENQKCGKLVIKEFVEITDQLVTVFDFTRKLVRYGHVTSDDGIIATVNIQGSNLPEENDPFFSHDHQVDLPVLPRCAFYQTCYLMNLCAHHPTTAALFHEHAVSDLLAVEKFQYLRAKDTPDQHCGECAVHMLMGTMARYCHDAAENFTKPHAKGGSPFFIVEKLVHAVKQIGTTRQNRRLKGFDHQNTHDANVIACLSGILYSSPSACERVTNRNSDINANTFITNLMKFAKESTGALTSASLNALLVITESQYLRAWRETMETECDLASKLQEIMKNLLLSMKSWNDSTREAMIRSLKLMQMYSANSAEISAQLNNSDFEGYDRESIVFKILQSNDTSVTDDVKYAASSVLRVVRLNEFDKSEIRAVVDMISAVPALVSNQTYQVMTNIIYLLFKMAMDYGGDREEESCGRIFRDIYAAEVMAAMYGNISRALEGDAANTAQAVDTRKRAFEAASVKFLQTGWMQPDLNKGLRSDAVVNALLICMQTEQEILSTARPKMFQDHQHLFLEQTPVGFDVRNMLRCLRILKQRDIVTFRCIHQIAHCLNDHSHEDILLNLNQAARTNEEQDIQNDPFDTWINRNCGHDIDALAERERKAWKTRFNVLKSKYKVRLAGQRDTDATKVAEIQLQYINRVYKSKGDISEMKARWAKTFNEKADRSIHLIMEDEELDSVVAFCGGGPKRGDTNDMRECELYGFYINNSYLGNGDALLKQLFMYFSHYMFALGYRSCIAWLCEAEQVSFASSKCIQLNRTITMKLNENDEKQSDDNNKDDDDDDNEQEEKQFEEKNIEKNNELKDMNISAELKTVVAGDQDKGYQSGSAFVYAIVDNDPDPTNELQTLSLSDKILSISDGNSVDLSVIASDTSSAIQSLSLNPSSSGTTRIIDISGGGTGVTFDVADNDNSDANEIQTLSLNSADNTITLSNNGGTVSIADNDNDSSNELQTLSQDGNTITLSDGGGTISIDSDSTNELQILSQDGNTITLSNGGGSVTIDTNDGDSDSSNELQSLSSSASGTTRTIDISGGSGTSINVADNDNDSSNELQTLSVTNGNTITLSNGGGSVTIDTNDGDSDSSNEFNTDLSLNGNSLELTDGGGVLSVDLSSLVDDADNDPTNELQTLTVTKGEGNEYTFAFDKGDVIVANTNNDKSLKSNDQQSGTLDFNTIVNQVIQQSTIVQNQITNVMTTSIEENTIIQNQITNVIQNSENTALFKQVLQCLMDNNGNNKVKECADLLSQITSGDTTNNSALSSSSSATSSLSTMTIAIAVLVACAAMCLLTAIFVVMKVQRVLKNFSETNNNMESIHMNHNANNNNANTIEMITSA